MTGILNQESIDEVKSIMKDKFPMMIEYFIEDSHGYIASINEGIEANDLKKIKSSAHTIKSSSNQLGAEKMSGIAKEIEYLSNSMIEGSQSDGDLEKLKALFVDLKDSFSEAEPELKSLI